MEWTSDEGVFISFQEKGYKIATNTSLTISPLTPSTKYIFKVVMITREAGQGAEVGVSITTNEEIGGDDKYYSPLSYKLLYPVTV